MPIGKCGRNKTMFLESIQVKNYRLLRDVTIDLDQHTTIIVGRNNAGKTSLMSLIEKVTRGEELSFNDYPIISRNSVYCATEEYLKGNIKFEELVKKIEVPMIQFAINYDLDDPNDLLGALSPFIIDTDVNETSAIISARYCFVITQENFDELFEETNESGEVVQFTQEQIKKIVRKNFSLFFKLMVEALNPMDDTDKQIKTVGELNNLFPVYVIRAERGMDESENFSKNPLSPILSRLLKPDFEIGTSGLQDEVTKLKTLVDEVNMGVEEKANSLLADILDKSVDFGYPNAEELKLRAITRISLDEQIKNQTDLAYIAEGFEEELPSTYNGLGYKNLIKIEFELAEFARTIAEDSEASIPLLFLEEPESHMHPQLQQTFVKFLTDFLDNLSTKKIQVLLTTHSSHIANAVPFNQIRYVQKCQNRVEYKDLSIFHKENEKNADFIHKYLTLHRCDLFFADKAILIEGTSERLLLPDMITKCSSLYTSGKPHLPSQYCSIIEVGGAYAHIFCPFMEFLGIPTLIITDIDSVDQSGKKEYVSSGKKSSNATVNWWVRRSLKLKDNDEISLENIINLTDNQKTNGISHIEFQTEENGICGRSLEESIKNVNRVIFNLSDNPTEKDIDFSDKKSDFALNLLFENNNYEVPEYIKKGLCWLDKHSAINE